MGVAVRLDMARWTVSGFPVDTVIVEGWVISGSVARPVVLP